MLFLSKIKKISRSTGLFAFVNSKPNNNAIKYMKKDQSVSGRNQKLKPKHVVFTILTNKTYPQTKLKRLRKVNIDICVISTVTQLFIRGCYTEINFQIDKNNRY